MKSMIKSLGCVVMMSLSTWVQAVKLDANGLGQVLIIPYYGVNNGLNTLLTVTNTTIETKAIKITFREAQNGYAVYTFNVYLSAFDVWTWVVLPDEVESAHQAEEYSIMMVSGDTSCAPQLRKLGQTFTTEHLEDGVQSLSRLREGFIEVIEMGVGEGDLDFWADPYNVGVPNNCAAIESAWEPGGVWHADSGGDPTQFLSSPTGGLMAEANLIDVAQGINYTIPTVALSEFWAAGEIHHVAPDDPTLSLDAAAPIAWVQDEDSVHQVNMNSGIDAVSAVLMVTETHNSFVLDQVIDGQTEIIFTFPTRRFYLNSFEPTNNTHPPFQPTRQVRACGSSLLYGGTEIDHSHNLFDRETQTFVSNSGSDDSRPTPELPAICGSVFVQSFYLPGQTPDSAVLTDSGNWAPVMSPVNAVANSGWVRTQFTGVPLTGVDVHTEESVLIHGLPVLNVNLYRATNSGAADGLLAQYGGSNRATARTRVD